MTAKRSPGNVVNVISLDSDVLTVESEDFSGKVSVGKTDFWERAEDEERGLERISERSRWRRYAGSDLHSQCKRHVERRIDIFLRFQS